MKPILLLVLSAVLAHSQTISKLKCSRLVDQLVIQFKDPKLGTNNICEAVLSDGRGNIIAETIGGELSKGMVLVLLPLHDAKDDCHLSLRLAPLEPQRNLKPMEIPLTIGSTITRTKTKPKPVLARVAPPEWIKKEVRKKKKQPPLPGR